MVRQSRSLPRLRGLQAIETAPPYNLPTIEVENLVELLEVTLKDTLSLIDRPIGELISTRKTAHR